MAAIPQPVQPFEQGLDGQELIALRLRREQVNGQIAAAPDSRMGRAAYRATHPAPENSHELRPLGVCFSGGGIRSATFHLGVIQGLCRQGLLPYIDYLSTVSGGGYIGSFLHGVIRQHGGNPVDAQAELARQGKPGGPQDDPVSFLRKYSNYLAPSVGLFSADTWTIAGVWLRNMGLNLLILIPFLGALLLLPRILGMFHQNFATTRQTLWWTWLWALAFVVVVIDARLFLIVAAEFPGSGMGKLRKALSGLGGFLLRFLWLPVLLAAAVEAFLVPGADWWMPLAGAGVLFLAIRYLGRVANRWTWAAILATMLAAYILGAAPKAGGNDFTLLFVLLTGLFFLNQLLGGFVPCFWERHKTTGDGFKTAAIAGLLFTIPVVCGLVTAGGMFELRKWLASVDGWLAITCGPGLIVLVWMVGLSLQIGLMGSDLPDTAREWLTQFGAELAIVAVAWTGFFALSVFGPLGTALLARDKGPALYTAVTGWIASGLSAYFAGASAKTKGAATNGATATSPSMEKVAAVAPPLFMALTFLLLAFGAHMAVREIVFQTSQTAAPHAATWKDWFTPICDDYWRELDPSIRPPHPEPVSWPLDWIEATPSHATMALSLAGILTALLLSLRININEFSMHHFYKNRLVRCYLGAGNARKRHPDWLTGFDPADDFKISSLQAGSDYNGPYPIVNCALNLNTGSELATAERKAASFVFTPIACGFEPKHSRGEGAYRDRKLSADGYRNTVDYMMPEGPALGTAMAISGAAANPNAGFHTSTPLAFLLTVFNVRLGWWVGNPRRAIQSRHSGPRVALRSLLAELFAQTDSRSLYVNLSDGGHFENLGLYELVRRRCRYIIAGDAEEDPRYSFEALGSAIRKCRADFGVEIDIDIDSLRPAPGKTFSAGHCVVGTIHYREPERGAGSPMCPEAEPADPADMQGWLVYFKASLTGDEPEDVQQYQGSHPVFPHEPTSNQFFTESQFESYRRLGEHVVVRTFDRIAMPNDASAQGRLLHLFQDLYRKWHPASIEEKAGNFTERYNDLMQRLAKDADLEFIGSQFFPNRPVVADPGTAESARKSFYYCLDVLQLMEDLYFTLELTEKENRYNPAYAGWMSTFKVWTGSAAVQRTWAIARNGYNQLFQAFFEEMS